MKRNGKKLCVKTALTCSFFLGFCESTACFWRGKFVEVAHLWSDVFAFAALKEAASPRSAAHGTSYSLEEVSDVLSHGALYVCIVIVRRRSHHFSRSWVLYEMYMLLISPPMHTWLLCMSLASLSCHIPMV